MSECLSEITLQALFDGELDRETTLTILSHLTRCQNCARAAATTENENRLLIEALQLEFGNVVPFERAYQRIQRAISSREISFVALANNYQTRWWNAKAALFLFSSGAARVSAVLALVVLSTIFVTAYLKRNAPNPLARIESNAPGSGVSPTPNLEVATSGSNSTPKEEPHSPKRSGEFDSRNSARRTRRLVSHPPLPGEGEFERRLALLAAAIESSSRMQPSLRVEYKHNLALLNQVIELTRNAARNNPGDSQAVQFMFAAYQGKIDFLSQVAEANRFNSQD